jgi:hypothetical protein
MPVPRRCPYCGGHFNYRTSLFEHWNDCTNKIQPEYPEAEQVRDEAELRGVPMPALEHPDGHDCEDCENARRAALTEAYPWLGKFGLSPTTEIDI